jgi:hypothetical protein
MKLESMPKCKTQNNTRNHLANPMLFFLEIRLVNLQQV